VANPPFSAKAWSNGVDALHDPYGRFALGVPPAKNGDYAFLLHLLSSLKSTGKGAIILPHGVLFRGGAEGVIRRHILEHGYITGIIGLPANLFFGTGIPACIVVLDKENATSRKGVFMIDASRDYLKDGPKNRLRAQDIHRVVDAFTRRAEHAGYARMVPLAEIAANDYNLNIPRYIDSSTPQDLQDIAAHLHGGIPARDVDALERYWQVFPSLKSCLFERGARDSYEELAVDAAEVKPTIFGHPEFVAFTRTVEERFATWVRENAPTLRGITSGDKPKVLVAALSEGLLACFRDAPLLDPYDVYQHLMDYWAETMQDDVYLIVQEGWRGLSDGKPAADLIPPALLVARYFAVEAVAVEALEAARDAVEARLEEMAEEHGGEDGLLAEAKNDKGKLTAASIRTRQKDIMADPDGAEERALLNECRALMDEVAAAGKKAKDARKALEIRVAARYGVLDEDAVKALVVDDKWLARLAADVHGEMDRVSRALTERITTLAERYAVSLPALTHEVDDLTCRVDAHLKAMGFA